jgi:hypothetical protein
MRQAVRTVLASSPIIVEGAGLPDWIRDVAEVQSAGPIPSPAAKQELPDWLEDVRSEQEMTAVPIGGDTAVEQVPVQLDPPPVRRQRLEAPPGTVATGRHAEENSEDLSDGALTPKQRRRRAILLGLLSGVPFWLVVIVYLVYRYMDYRRQ